MTSQSTVEPQEPIVPHCEAPDPVVVSDNEHEHPISPPADDSDAAWPEAPSLMGKVMLLMLLPCPDLYLVSKSFNLPDESGWDPPRGSGLGKSNSGGIIFTHNSTLNC